MNVVTWRLAHGRVCLSASSLCLSVSFCFSVLVCTSLCANDVVSLFFCPFVFLSMSMFTTYLFLFVSACLVECVSASVCFLSFVSCLSSSTMWCGVGGVHGVVCVFVSVCVGTRLHQCI